MPGLCLVIFDDMQRKFLNSLKYNSIPLAAEVCGMIMHIAANYILVIKYDMGIIGTAMANNSTMLIVFSINFCYSTMIPEIQDAIQWPNASSLQGLSKYLELGIPCAIMRMLDICATLLMTFTTGLLGVEQQAAQLIILNIAIVFYMIGVGLQ